MAWTSKAVCATSALGSISPAACASRTHCLIKDCHWSSTWTTRSRGGPEHLTLEDRGRRLDRRQLQFFLGLEVRVEAALAHPDLGGQVADRQAVQPLRGGQSRRGVQDGGATGLAFGGVGHVAERAR